MKSLEYIVYRDNQSIAFNGLDSDSVSLKNGEWKNREMWNICPLIKQWKIKSLQVDQNLHSPILRQISEVKFPRLQRILFNSNKIQSIEGLNRIWLPVLTELYLFNNEFMSVQDIRKSFWPKLSILDLCQNKINEASQLSFILPVSQIQMEYFENEKKQVEDVRIFARMPIKKKSELWIQGFTRIRQKTVHKFLEKKYGEVLALK